MDIDKFVMNDFINKIDLDAGVIHSQTNIPGDAAVFSDHFPGFPVLPGSYIIETMAQACGFYLLAHNELESLPLFASIDRCRFYRFVKPNDTLKLECTYVRTRGDISQFSVKVQAGGSYVASAKIKMLSMPFPSTSIRDRLIENAGDIGMVLLPKNERIEQEASVG